MNRVRTVAVANGVYAALAPIATLASETPAPCDRRLAARVPASRADEHLASRALLRRLLAEAAGAGAAREPLSARPSGQPHLPGRPDLAVSLSHADGWVAAAVHLRGGSVGVDVQPPVPFSAAFVGRCCSEEARARLAELRPDERDLEVAWIWSAQEACVKATGVGLAGRPWTIPVRPGQRCGRWSVVRWTGLRLRGQPPVSCAYGPPPGERP